VTKNENRVELVYLTPM